jgi:hypothetical protein
VQYRVYATELLNAQFKNGIVRLREAGMATTMRRRYDNDNNEEVGNGVNGPSGTSGVHGFSKVDPYV